MDMTPLQIAGEVVEKTLHCKMPPMDNSSDAFVVEFEPLIVRMTEVPMPLCEVKVEWHSLGFFTDISIAAGFDLYPVKNPLRLGTRLAKEVEPFLEGVNELTRDVTGSFKILLEPSGTWTPYYQAHVDHEALEYEELTQAFQRTLMRGIKTLELLTPIFVCIEQGYIPNKVESVGSLQFAHALWEVNEFSKDVPKDGVRLPRRLYGGIGRLLPQ